jgi:hypothetical protein
MSKYKVECQTLITYEIEAEDEYEAQEKAFEKVMNDCMYEADGIDWSISAYEVNNK